MNEEDFQFFIDELRVYLHIRFMNFIESVEDFYNNTFLEMSKNFWE